MKNTRSKLILLCLVLLPLTACGSTHKPLNETLPQSDIKYTDSFEKIKAAADAGDAKAMYIIVFFYPALEYKTLTQKQIQDYLTKAATMRYPDAEGKLMNAYRYGYYGFSVDYRKAIYWAERYSCDGLGDHEYLAAINGAETFTPLQNEERSLVKEDVSLAYAHLTFIPRKIFANRDDLRSLATRMTPDQLERAEQYIELFRNGGCPYDLTSTP